MADFVQEALIISDLFKLNEMTSVELLLSGEAEMTSNPEMGSRGLIAVLNYYKSQKIIVESLRNLLQAKLIIDNDNPRAMELINFTEMYCESLFQGGLFSRLLGLLKSLDIKSEKELLETQRALGASKHRRQFYVIFNKIKETLADCVMLRSFKTPLNTSDTKILIGFMRTYFQDQKLEVNKLFIQIFSNYITYWLF